MHRHKNKHLRIDYHFAELKNIKKRFRYNVTSEQEEREQKRQAANAEKYFEILLRDMRDTAASIYLVDAEYLFQFI